MILGPKSEKMSPAFSHSNLALSGTAKALEARNCLKQFEGRAMSAVYYLIDCWKNIKVRSDILSVRTVTWSLLKALATTPTSQWDSYPFDSALLLHGIHGMTWPTLPKLKLPAEGTRFAATGCTPCQSVRQHWDLQAVHPSGFSTSKALRLRTAAGETNALRDRGMELHPLGLARRHAVSLCRRRTFVRRAASQSNNCYTPSSWAIHDACPYCLRQ